MNKILFLLFIFISGFIFGLDLDIDTENKLRTEYTSEDSGLNTDFRTQISLDIITDFGLYQKSKLELGYINIEDLFNISSYLIETKELYLGYKKGLFDGKLGVIDVKAPREIYEGEDLGLQLKFTSDYVNIKGFYTVPNFLSDTWEVLEETEELSHLLFISTEYTGLTNHDIKLWYSLYNDNDENDFTYSSNWLGIDLEGEYKSLEYNTGYIYNFGELSYHKANLNAWFVYCDLSLNLENKTKITSRVNLFGNFYRVNTVNQFQTVDGDGSVKTGLSILKDLYLDSDDLSTNDVVYEDVTMFFYELEFEKEFNTLPLQSNVIFGGVRDENSLVGLEVDVNNKIDILKDLELNIDAGYLFLSDNNMLKIGLNLEYHF